MCSNRNMNTARILRRAARAAAAALIASLSMASFAGEQAASAEDKYVYDAVKVAQVLVESRDIYDRILAAGALAEVGDLSALAILERCVANSDLVIKRSAIDTLISAVHPNSTDLLFKSASDDPVVLGLLIESLASMPRDDMDDLLLDALQDGNLHTQRHALQALVRTAASGMDAEVQKLISDPATNSTVRAYAYYARVSSGHADEVMTAVIGLAESGDSAQKEVAAVALGLIDTDASKQALQTLSKETEQRVSLAALASNAGLGNDAAIAQLIQLIAYGTPMESAVLAGSLKRMPGAMAGEITTTLLTCCQLKADAATRLLESWGWITSDPEAVYKWGLGHENADVRLQTLWLIGQRKDPEVLAKVATFLKDEDPALRGMAAWAIIHTAGERYVPGVEI